MKIAFLLHNAYAIGGTVRTTLNLAAALAGEHETEVVSLMRHREAPRFPVDGQVRLVPLVDIRADSADAHDPRAAEPARAFPAADRRHRQYSLLHDIRVQEYLEATDADVVIGTRPGLNVCLARFGPRRALRIAQEHLRHDAHSRRLRTELARHYRDVDALVTTTEADAAVYRARMPLPGVRVLAIPNIVPGPAQPLAGDRPRAKVVAAAGRLVRAKRFDLLIEAFAEVAALHPDWRLHIYGGGPEKEALRQLVERRELAGQVRLMGVVSPIEAEFAKASVVASASDAESFGMTLVEAMRCGAPVVSTDCPLGPAEIVTDGVDGRLVPVGDAKALADALLALIEDEPRRRAMGEAALQSAHRYDPDRVVRRYERLFAELAATRRRRARERDRARTARRIRRVVRRARSGLRGVARRLRLGG